MAKKITLKKGRRPFRKTPKPRPTKIIFSKEGKVFFGFALLLTLFLFIFTRPQRTVEMNSQNPLAVFEINSSLEDQNFPFFNYQEEFWIISSLTSGPSQMSDRKGDKKPSTQQLTFLFAKYGQEYGVNKQILEKVAFCESSFSPKAVNGPYAGLFQFLPSTWIANRRAMGLDTNPNLRFHPEEAIKTASFKISRDGLSAWPVCGRMEKDVKI